MLDFRRRFLRLIYAIFAAAITPLFSLPLIFIGRFLRCRADFADYDYLPAPRLCGALTPRRSRRDAISLAAADAAFIACFAIFIAAS
jgi:hypothetical protein